MKRLVSLRRLYLWQSKVTPEAGKALADELEDKDRIAELERNIASLKSEISRAQIEVNTGVGSNAVTQVASVSAPAVAGKPINDTCPVSGKPVDLTKTFVYRGQLIAFCCGKCCAQFQKNPNKYLAKLGIK